MLSSQRQSEGLRRDYERMERDRVMRHALLNVDGHGITRPRNSDQNTNTSSSAIRERQFKNCTIIECDYSGIVLQGLVFNGTKFIRCNFSRSILRGCKFINVQFIDCNFTGYRKINTRFYKCKINNCIGISFLKRICNNFL